MKNFSTWLIVIFMIMFFVLRTVICVCEQMGVDLLGIVSYNLNLEITILFLTILCIALVAKRNLFGSLIYLLIYGTYFGEHLLSNFSLLMQSNNALTVDMSLNLIMDVCAIVLAIFALLDMFLDRSRKANPIDKKTDWYFKNEKYDEELNARDSRDDKNHYKYY